MPLPPCSFYTSPVSVSATEVFSCGCRGLVSLRSLGLTCRGQPLPAFHGDDGGQVGIKTLQSFEDF